MATMPKPTTPTDAEQAIRALAQEFVKYYNARDIEKLLTLFTKDGRTFAPFHPLVEGISGLRQRLQQDFVDFDPRELKVETTYVEVNGTIGFSFGTFTMNIRTSKGPRLNDTGKWVVTLRRENGKWHIVGHIYNTDLPMETLAAM